MAWTAQVADVFPAFGIVTVRVAFTEGATTFNMDFHFEVGTTKAAALAQMAEQKAAIIASLDYAKAARTLLLGEVI